MQLLNFTQGYFSTLKTLFHKVLCHASLIRQTHYASDISSFSLFTINTGNLVTPFSLLNHVLLEVWDYLWQCLSAEEMNSTSQLPWAQQQRQKDTLSHGTSDFSKQKKRVFTNFHTEENTSWGLSSASQCKGITWWPGHFCLSHDCQHISEQFSKA